MLLKCRVSFAGYLFAFNLACFCFIFHTVQLDSRPIYIISLQFAYHPQSQTSVASEISSSHFTGMQELEKSGCSHHCYRPPSPPGSHRSVRT